MFLIFEDRSPQSNELLLARRQAQLQEQPRGTSSLYSIAEHEDSIKGVEFFLDEFDFEGKLGYAPGIAGLKADIWADLVRNIGLATAKARSVHQQPGFSSQEFPILDWLSARLLEKVFECNYGSPDGAQFGMFNHRYSGLKKSFREISFWGLVSELNGVHLGADIKKSGFTIVPKEFIFQSVGKRQKLIFEVTLENGLASGLKVSKRSRPVNPEADSILSDIRGILLDQKERVAQANRCLDTPFALGPSPELAYSIVGKLADLGFPAGSYSRSSLGAGVFPDSRYCHKSRDTKTTLVFVHCERCHSLTAITAREATEEQLRGLSAFSKDHIFPWHESICGKSPKEIEREDRLKRALQEERERIRERNGFLERKRNPDYYRKEGSYRL